MKNRSLRCAAALAGLLVFSLFCADLHAEEYDWDEPGQTEMQLLLAVMRNGNTVLMQEFLDGGLDVDSLIPIIRDRVPLLSLAMSTGQAGIGECLLAQGADVDQMSLTIVTPEETALDAVSLWGAPIQVFEVSQSYEDEVENASPLMYAVTASCPTCVLLLLQHDADVNARTHTGVTALMLAAASNQRVIVNMLLASGASIDDQAEDASDLFFAGARGDAAAEVHKELPSGPTEGASALWLAAYAGHAEIVALLLKAGAADNFEASFADGPDSQKDPVSCTAEGAAELRRHKQVIEAFDKAYADRQTPSPGKAAETGLLQSR